MHADRKLGYMIITLFLLIVEVILFYGLRPLLSRRNTRGGFQGDRQPQVSGSGPCAWSRVRNGEENRVEKRLCRKTMRAYVTVKSTMPIPIIGDIYCQHGRRPDGDRVILIDCGDSAAPLIPVRDTLVGTFYPGVSEALNNALQLRGVIDTFLAVSETLAHGAGTQKSFVAQVNQAVSSADSISTMVLGMTRNAGFTADAQVRSLNSFVKSTTTMTRSLATAAPEYVESTRTRLGEITALASTLRRSADTLAALSPSLRNPADILWKNDIEDIGKHLVE